MSEPSVPSAGMLQQVIAGFGDATLLVVGDLILDRFIKGDIERISPEAPIPVLLRRDESVALGGAANVVANIVALGGTAIPFSAVGDDQAGRDVIARLATLGVETGGVVAGPARRTSCKTRFSALNQQILRFDEEEIRALDGAERSALLERFGAALARADVVILSDYGKGVLLDGMAAELIRVARAAGKPVLVDPKGRDFSRYAGATEVSPNRKELGEAAGRAVSSDEEITAAARELIAAHGLDYLVATRSEKGISVVEPGQAHHISTQAREVFDVSGAGDTVIASFALAVAAGATPVHAAAVANAAGGVVVGKRGTATVSVDELQHALFSTQGPARHVDAILDADAARRLVEGWKSEGLRVGFTNGCFDILHAGHVGLLNAARAQCDRLVLGLNSDTSVRRLKGDGRPVNGERDRAAVLAALASVDAVVVFSQDTPLELIAALKPDVLIKGADYTIEQVVGADIVQQHGGRVVLVPLVPGRSTTGTIGKLRAVGGREG